MAETFAFIIHPVNPRADIGRRYPLLGRILTPRQIDFLCTFWPPLIISQIDGVTSLHNGREATGWFIAVPYTPRRMLELPERVVYDKIVAAGHIAERLGARILGLGAFTAVVGDAGQTIARRLDIPVTTGDAYTVAVVVQAIEEAARSMGIALESASAAVVGASGAIGRAAAVLLAGRVGRLLLIGRRPDALEETRACCAGGRAHVTTSTDLGGLREADLILTVTNAVSAVIEPEHLKPGAVVLEAAVPPDVSRRGRETREDVLVIQGGMVQVPGPVDFHFDFGYPPGKAYACMAETMALALEGRYEDYTIGREIDTDRVREIETIAARHGFRLAGLRAFAQEVTPEQIARVRDQAAR